MYEFHIGCNLSNNSFRQDHFTSKFSQQVNELRFALESKVSLVTSVLYDLLTEFRNELSDPI